MDKGKWISAKIRELEHENKGRSHEQNIAIAFSMWNERKEEGGQQFPEYQIGGTQQDPLESLKGTWKEKLPEYWSIEQKNAHAKKVYDEKQKSDASYKLSPEISRQAFPGMQEAFGGSSTSTFGNKNYGTPVTTGGTPEVKSESFNFAKNPGPSVSAPAAPAQSTPTKPATRFAKPEIATNAEQDMKDVEASNLSNLPEVQTDEDIRFTEQYKKDENQIALNEFRDQHKQFFNPYGGIDLETSLVGLGQGIERGDTKAIVGNSLLAGLKGARNVMGGMGLANRENQVMQDYWDKQREGMIGNSTYIREDGGFFQDGGNVMNKEIVKEDFKRAMDRRHKFDEVFVAPVTPTVVAKTPSVVNKVVLTRPRVEGKFTTFTDHSYQDGGEQFQNPQEVAPQELGQEQQVGQQEQMMQQVAEALQSGATPEQVVQKLVESGIPEEQAVQIVQAVIQQTQGQQQQAPQEQPQMKDGGEYLSLLKGKKIKDYKLDPKTNMYTVEYE